MKAGERGVRAVSNLFDLPKEATLGLPRIIILGHEEMLIENHCGIVEYSPEIITVATKSGSTSVTGGGLLLKSIDTERIHITGKIITILFEL